MDLDNEGLALADDVFTEEEHARVNVELPMIENPEKNAELFLTTKPLLVDDRNSMKLDDRLRKMVLESARNPNFNVMGRLSKDSAVFTSCRLDV